MIKLFNPYSAFSAFFITSRLVLFFISLHFIFSGRTTIIIWEITTISSSFLYFPVIFDSKGLLFSSVVLFISANVINFSKTYITGEKFNTRFALLVILFVLSINILIFFPHIITLLLGWDGLGLTRFILVIYYQNSKSLGAGIITALTNRLGDAFLLLAIGWSLNINHWSINLLWDTPIKGLIIASITLAAITKRAQIPFSSWLPAAIAAPTPVSALVHSSTLVTAGVFLLIRFYDFLSIAPYFNLFLLLVSCFTILMAGISALTECDLKKIIALSTLSQLGVIIIRLALGCPNLAFFHLITHALFKALLFICAGSVIHFHHHAQDLRLTGSLTNQLPLTISALLIANMSLCGLPFLSGFYSKDLILETSIFNSTNWLILIILLLATILTIAYSFRFTLNLVWAPKLSLPAHFINNRDINILAPSIFLTIGAITTGSIINWEIPLISQETFIPLPIKLMPFLATILAAYIIFQSTPTLTSTKSSLIQNTINHHASSLIWFLTPLSTQAILPTTIKISHLIQKNLDQGWLELFSAQGIFLYTSSISKTLQLNQKNPPLILMYLSSFIFLSFFIFYIFTSCIGSLYQSIILKQLIRLFYAPKHITVLIVYPNYINFSC